MEDHFVKQKQSSRTLTVYRIYGRFLIKDSLRANFFNNNRIDSTIDLTQVNFA